MDKRPFKVVTMEMLDGSLESVVWEDILSKTMNLWEPGTMEEAAEVFHCQIFPSVPVIVKCFFICFVLFLRFVLLFSSSGFIQQDSSWRSMQSVMMRKRLKQWAFTRTATKQLQKGWAIGVFLDGSRQVDGRVNNPLGGAALLAARKNKRIVTMSDIEEAKDKVMMGAERRSMVMTEDDKKLTAYHEGAHAIVALNEQASEPINKATMIPRGRALGVVWTLPERDKYSHTR